MHAKLIDPKTNGSKAYDNKGSSTRTVNYLKQEAEKGGQEAAFFGAASDEISGADLMQQIDTNVKGLRGTDDKFYSLVLSPSADELAHIGNDDQKLKAYTRQVMEQYARNFNLKDGCKLTSENLVWGATIHHERKYRGTDAEVTAGTAKAGEGRPGLQSHIHIIVSARDSEQKVTLNPDGRRERFNLIEWQKGAGQQFEKQFGYTAQEHEKLKPKQRDSSRDEARAARIGERVEVVNKLVPKDQQLDPERVKEIAASREYDKTFYRMMNRVEDRAQKGQPIDNAYQLLATGQEQPQQRAVSVSSVRAVQALKQVVRATNTREEQTEHIAEKKGRNRDELDIEM
jgi:hypothetical protein